jgi:hypothetical protein
VRSAGYEAYVYYWRFHVQRIVVDAVIEEEDAQRILGELPKPANTKTIH